MKIKTITTLLLTSLLYCACNTEEPIEKPHDEASALHVGISCIQTKTWLDYTAGGSPLKVYWSDGDKINVNGSSSLSLSVEENDTIPVADFKIYGVEAPFNVIYPATIVNGTTYDSDGYMNVKLPSTQLYHPTTFASGAAIMCGYSEDANVTLSNLCSAVRVNVKGTETIVSASVLSASESAPLCGDFKINPQAGILAPVGGSVKLTLDLTENIALNEKNGVDFFFTLPAGDYSEGLTFFFEREDSRIMECIWTPDSLLNAGVLYSFNDVKYVPGAKDITSAEEWEEFATALNADPEEAENAEVIRKYVYKKGFVRLGADIQADNLTSITNDFPYILEGNGKTIRIESATNSLFKNLTGEIRNLTLAGSLDLKGEGAPFVTNLYAGAKIIGCTNKMNVTFEAQDSCYVSAFAAVASSNDTEGLTVLEISDCTNNGSITGIVDVTQASYTTSVAGFIGEIRANDGSVPYDVILSRCYNKAPITLSPKSGETDTYGMSSCGVGGIIGWSRGSNLLALDDCDNSGAITIKADNIMSTTGLKACVTGVGGIIGNGAAESSGYISLDGQNFSLTGCDNTGTIYNCMVNSSAPADVTNKVYTGGIAGVLVGTTEKYASINACSNTGTVLAYDICSDDESKPDVVSDNCAYSAVLGGFIGIGGNVDIDGCTVNCQIGNGKRPIVAWGGVIGYIIKPFIINNLNLIYSGFFQRVSTNTTYKFNRGVIGVVPDANIDYIRNSELKGYLNASGILKTAGDLKNVLQTNLTTTLTVSLFNSPTKASGQLINGGTADNASKLLENVTNEANFTYTTAQ